MRGEWRDYPGACMSVLDAHPRPGVVRIGAGVRRSLAPAQRLTNAL